MANLVVVVHIGFVCFVILGGLGVLRWHRLAWIHLAGVAWGVGIEWSGGVCPLTPWENWLRARSGEVGYESDFLDRYMLPILYPVGLTRTGQIILGGVVLVGNLAVYIYVWLRCGRTRL